MMVDRDRGGECHHSLCSGLLQDGLKAQRTPLLFIPLGCHLGLNKHKGLVIPLPVDILSESQSCMWRLLPALLLSPPPCWGSDPSSFSWSSTSVSFGKFLRGPSTRGVPLALPFLCSSYLISLESGPYGRSCLHSSLSSEHSASPCCFSEQAISTVTYLKCCVVTLVCSHLGSSRYPGNRGTFSSIRRRNCKLEKLI